MNQAPAPLGGLADRDVDDLAVPGFEHVRHDGPRGQEIAENVGDEQVAEAVRADAPEAHVFGHEVRIHGAHADAGVVDKDVDAAEVRQRAVDAGGDGLLVADVHHEPGHSGIAVDPDGGILDARLGPAGQDDAGTGSGQRLAHGEAKAAGPPGDECADSFEVWRGPWARWLGHTTNPPPRGRQSGRRRAAATGRWGVRPATPARAASGAGRRRSACWCSAAASPEASPPTAPGVRTRSGP